MAVLFFLPLIVSTELHQLSHSLVHAFLARLGDATITLAAFSIAFAFNTTCSGIISVEVQAAMSYVTDKRSFWRIARFYFAISLVPFLVIEAVALTPLGDWLFGVMMGASPETTRLAKLAAARHGPVDFPEPGAQHRHRSVHDAPAHAADFLRDDHTARFAGAHAAGAAVLDGRGSGRRGISGRHA